MEIETEVGMGHGDIVAKATGVRVTSVRRPVDKVQCAAGS